MPRPAPAARERADLGEWARGNPQWWAVLLATAASTAMDLGAGMVDVLRVGEGIARGGAGGVAQDALRALGFVAPLARGGAWLGRIAQHQASRSRPPPGSGAWVLAAVSGRSGTPPLPRP